MDFSLTTLFVVPDGTLASSGSTDALAADQLGIFRPDHTLATAGNIAAAKYFYIAQGRRNVGLTGMSSKKSDKINATNVIEWYKTTAEDTAAVQDAVLSDFHIQCDEDITFTVRIHSRFTDITNYNGLTRSVVVKGPCCNCGEVPCADVTGAQTQAVVQKAVEKFQADPIASKYLTFQRIGDLAAATIVITAKPQATLTVPTDISASVFEQDRVWFRAFAYSGTPTLTDVFVDDVCEGVTAVATITHRATVSHGSSAEVKQLEKQFYSYQTSHFKSLYKNSGYNGAFSSQVVDGLFYDLYYIKCREVDQLQTWGDYVPQDFTVILAFESTEGAAFETVLTAALGAPKNQSGIDLVTTTTTTTSTTTTTTTTALIP